MHPLLRPCSAAVIARVERVGSLLDAERKTQKRLAVLLKTKAATEGVESKLSERLHESVFT